MTVATWVCCSMISDSQMRYGSRVFCHGRSWRPCCFCHATTVEKKLCLPRAGVAAEDAGAAGEPAAAISPAEPDTRSRRACALLLFFTTLPPGARGPLTAHSSSEQAFQAVLNLALNLV